MAGVKLELEVDHNGAVIERHLAELGTAIGDRKPFFKDVGEYLLQSIEERFRNEENPLGQAWPDVTPATRERKRNPKILTESRRLRRSNVYAALSDRLEVGTNVVYAATHQRGRGPIPERPWLGINDRDRDEILTLYVERFERAVA